MISKKVQSPQELAKKNFREQNPNGFFQYFDPTTGKLKEEGKFVKGEEIGIWKEYDENGKERHYEYVKNRIGAICKDGSSTERVGHGACSRHGGVEKWIYEYVKTLVKTEKQQEELSYNVDNLRKKVKMRFGTQKDGLEFQQYLLTLVLTLSQENKQLKNTVDYLLLEEKEILVKYGLQGQKKPKENLKKQAIQDHFVTPKKKKKKADSNLEQLFTGTKGFNHDSETQQSKVRNSSSETFPLNNLEHNLSQIKKLELNQLSEGSLISMSEDLGTDSDQIVSQPGSKRKCRQPEVRRS